MLMVSEGNQPAADEGTSVNTTKIIGNGHAVFINQSGANIWISGANMDRNGDTQVVWSGPFFKTMKGAERAARNWLARWAE